MGNLMDESFILCRYSESADGQIKLVKVGKFDSKERDKIERRAFELRKEDSKVRLVLLTELEFPTDSRAW